MVLHYKTRGWGGFKRLVAARPGLLKRADLRLKDHGLRRERDRIERTRGKPVEFARSSHFDILIPIYADGTVGDTALYPLSADDLVDGQ